MAHWLDESSKIRDRAIIFAGAVYILGFGVRGFWSWMYNLGLISAIDEQYFVAGIIPAFILGAAGAVSLFIKQYARVAWMVFSLISVTVVPAYVLWFYPLMPQGIGGANPRCAHLYFKSPETVREPVVKFLEDSAAYKQRSDGGVTVRVISKSSRSIIVEPRTENSPWSLTWRPSVFEVERNALEAILWCGSNEPSTQSPVSG